MILAAVLRARRQGTALVVTDPSLGASGFRFVGLRSPHRAGARSVRLVTKYRLARIFCSRPCNCGTSMWSTSQHGCKLLTNMELTESMGVELVSQFPNGSSESDWRWGTGAMTARQKRLLSVFCALVMLFAAPAHSAVSLRVEARPLDAPISAFATVTDTAGNPSAADGGRHLGVRRWRTGCLPELLIAARAERRLEGLNRFRDGLQPSVQDVALAPMKAGVIDFINSMKAGDYAAIVKFNVSSGATVVRAFTQIDGAAGTKALIDAVDAPYTGSGTNIYDAVLLSVQQFTAPPLPLPAGPKAVVWLVTAAKTARLPISIRRLRRVTTQRYRSSLLVSVTSPLPCRRRFSTDLPSRRVASSTRRPRTRRLATRT